MRVVTFDLTITRGKILCPRVVREIEIARRLCAAAAAAAVIPVCNPRQYHPDINTFAMVS